jgi:hypothetical protein
MVSEFLRTSNAVELGLPRLGSLLTPVGRTMKDIDIAGISEEGSTVFVQVTFSDQKKVIKDKIKSLETYSDGRNELLMFCQTRERKTIGKVEVVPLQDVFTAFTSTDSGKEWLKRAIEWIYPK